MELSKRQNEIINAAIQIIAANGIQGLTTKVLAAAVGVSEPALYRHFKNKTEIIRLLIMKFDAGLEDLQNGNKGWLFVKTFFARRIEQVIAEPALANILYSEELFLHVPE